MMTLRQFSLGIESIPISTSWYLAELGEALGKQELFTKQSPQKLKALREHAVIESAVSSNRIEGVVIEQSRIGTVVFGKSKLRDRDEEEVRGYRDALRVIHELCYGLPITESNLKEFHRKIMGRVADAGQYKEKDGDIIEKYPDGRERVRFKTVTAADAPEFMRGIIGLWNDCLRERWVHPLIAMAAMNLDFLCVHPFRDGNGRVSRLLLLLGCYHLGYEVGRYVSLERIIEENKERYYETLEESSRAWHEGKQNPWPYVNYLLFILKIAYREFEERVGHIASPKGAKTEMVINAITKRTNAFSVADIQRQCPSVSVDLIRIVLKKLRPQVECLGRGRDAKWQKTSEWSADNTRLPG
ncbi:MAG: Fic family protein [Blastocatellia bacterium]